MEPSFGVQGYDRLTEHERENFTEEGFKLYRAESLENLVGDLYTDVCTFSESDSRHPEPEFQVDEFGDRIEEIIDTDNGEIDLSNIYRDHWQPTSYGVNADEISQFAESAVKRPIFETTERPTAIITEMVVPPSEIEFDLPKDDSSVTSKPISRYYAEREKEYHAHYQTPAEWISSIRILDIGSDDKPPNSGLNEERTLENISHDPDITLDTYEPISWELSNSLDQYPEEVRQRVKKDDLGR